MFGQLLSLPRVASIDVNFTTPLGHSAQVRLVSSKIIKAPPLLSNLTHCLTAVRLQLQVSEGSYSQGWGCLISVYCLSQCQRNHFLMDPDMRAAIRNFQSVVYERSFVSISEQQAKTQPLSLLGGPDSIRPAPLALAKWVRGRCFSVQYRLAPQNIFPAAISDVFFAYLCLLYPPAGAYHDTIPAANIVLSGESSGEILLLH
jgi:hypothetical protein